MTIDPERSLGGGAVADMLARLIDVVRPQRIVTGWATVELDRAETETVAVHGLAAGQVPRAAPDDELLGARCRLIPTATGDNVVLLEPSTEGRLAGALARHGEGAVALYLLADVGAADRVCAAGIAMTARAPGPFGRQRLILVGRRDDPFVMLATHGAHAPPA